MSSSRIRLTEEALKNISTQKSFQKGVNYYEMNMVNNPVIDDNIIKGEVTGRSASFYEVEINLENPQINYCTCPYDWGGVCKHIIALGLTWLKEKNKFTSLKEERENLKMELSDYFKELNKDDLINILTELIQKNENLKFKIMDYLQEQGKMSDKLYINKIKNLKNQALKIANEFNQYGGGSREDENTFYNNIRELEDLIDKETSSDLRQEIIRDFMGEYLKRNSGLNDPLLDIVFHTAYSKDEWKLIISELQKLKSKYAQERIMSIYLHKLNNEEKYLELRKQYLEYGMDYYQLACYYQDNGETEKAVETALKGKEEGKGRIRDNFRFLKEYYLNKGNNKKALKYAIETFKRAPSLAEYKLILDLCGDDKKEETKNELIDYLHNSRGHNNNSVLARIYDYHDQYKKIMKLVSNNKITPGNFKRKLVNKFPRKMIDYYKEQVQKKIKRKKRNYYRQAANITLKIKKIYLEILDSPEEWKKYINHILDNYPRHTALQEEFKNICF